MHEHLRNGPGETQPLQRRTVALDQLIIQQLPELVRAAAQGLQGANLTVLDGAEGLNGAVASIAAQGMAVLESLRAGLKTNEPSGVAEPAPVPNGTRQLVAGESAASS